MIPTEEVEEKGDFVYPSGIRLFLLMGSAFICMFLVALVSLHQQDPSATAYTYGHVQANQPRPQDKLIISTAIPAITNDFHAEDDIGWYGTAYLLTNCAFVLVFGKLYTFLSVKITFLTAVVLFELGSAICGAAPNSIAFIIGRAIAGLGAGGVQSGVVSSPFPLFTVDTHRSRCGASARHYRLRRSAGKTASIPGSLRGSLRGRLGDRTVDGWSLHLESNLEMVLLHQPSLGWRRPAASLLLAAPPQPFHSPGYLETQARTAQRPWLVCSPSGSHLLVPGVTMGWSHV